MDSEVILSNFNGTDRVYIACGYTGLRLGIDGLITVVSLQYGSQPDEESLFLIGFRLPSQKDSPRNANSTFPGVSARWDISDCLIPAISAQT